MSNLPSVLAFSLSAALGAACSSPAAMIIDEGASSSMDDAIATGDAPASTPRRDAYVEGSLGDDLDAPNEGAEPSAEADDGTDGEQAELGTGDLTVLIVADKSGSMATDWETQSRWDTASDILLQELDPLKDVLTVGAIFFPVGGTATCDVAPLGSRTQIPFMVGRDFMTAWKNRALQAPDGSTPMGAAFAAADQAIAQADELGLLEQRFRVAILTDGEPNCGTQTTTLERYAARWHERGIETLVIGLPGSSSARTLLDRIANAGGTEQLDVQETTEDLESTYYTLIR